MVSKARRLRLLIEQLEERQLLAGLPDLAPQLLENLTLATESARPSALSQGVNLTQQLVGSQFDSADVRRELVIIDEATPHYEQLLSDILNNGRPGRQIEALLIDSNRDGVELIGEILRSYRALDAVHVVSHGSEGALQLGTTVLSATNLNDYASSIQGWSSSLNDGADLLFYGCDVAESDNGKSLLNAISGLTGADVAASTDVTGHASLGGDWDLEFTVGPVETTTPFSTKSQQDWFGTLEPQTYFLPFPEEPAQLVFDTVNINANTSIFSATSIAATYDGTIIVYDQHEDGYESRGTTGGQVTTQVWGDNDPSNGIPPGFAVDLINSDDIIRLENIVETPRDLNMILYDGGDRIVASAPIAVIRAMYPTSPGTVNAGAAEVFPVSDWGTMYELPVGENLNSSFNLTVPFITASQDSTTVTIDTDGNGTIDITQELSRGQTYVVPTSTAVNVGAMISSNRPIQVHIATGEVGSSYEGRWYAMVPVEDWSNSYYAPVETTVTNSAAAVYVFNPHATSLTVNYQTQTTSGSFSVAAGTTVERTLVLGEGGAHFFTTDSRAFLPVAAIDKGDNSTQVNDWGYPLIPEQNLLPNAVVGWGPGWDPLFNGTPTSGNGSPVWVTPVANTTIYIDYDGNPLTGPNFDSFGNRYDVAVTLSMLDSYQIYDPDNDATGLRVYTLDGTKIAVAWGQDPATAAAGTPYLDMGTVVLPTPGVIIEKESTLAVDTNGNGFTDSGDTVRYIVTVTNVGVAPLNSPVLFDDLPGFVTYNPNTTTVDAVETVRDEFNTIAYSNQDGTENWEANWIETGDDNLPTSGNVAIVASGSNNVLRFVNNGASLAREVDLSAATSATLTFNYSLPAATEAGDDLVVEVSNNGGVSYTPLATYSGSTAAVSGYGSFVLDSYLPLTADVRVRFRSASGFTGAGEYVDIDNVQVAYDLPGQIVPDDLSPATAFPLDDAGYTLSDILPGESSVISFDVTVNSVPTTVGEITNTATIFTNQGEPSDSNTIPLSAVKQLYPNVAENSRGECLEDLHHPVLEVLASTKC